MRLHPTLAFALLAVSYALGAPPNPQVSSPAALPSVTAYALDRIKVTLPGDFAAPLNLLILSFQRDQQAMVDGWLPELTPDTIPGVQTWMLPVASRENGLYKWWLNASLRGSLPSSQPRRYTVPVYVNKPQFLGALRVTSEQEVVLLLTDKAGHVLWRTAGPMTNNKKTALSNFVKSAPH
jgi:hypothetical protein